ncbi:MAG: hypothetical protein IH959_08160 [Chloroflexi bacterium]|nr:hypothetical protein [Chloroflexota bacterium]
MGKLFVVGFVGVVLLAACGGGGGTIEEPASVEEANDSGIESRDEPTAVQQVEDEDLRQEIADTLEGFVEAFVNGNIVKLTTYLSETCSEEEREAATGASLLASAFVGGEAEYEVDADLLTFEIIDEDHVAVSQTQPEGAIRFTVDGRPLPDEDESEESPLTLAYEDGVWRVTNCGELAETD